MYIVFIPQFYFLRFFFVIIFMQNFYTFYTLGIDATGLPKDLESHYTVINKWDPIDAPQNHVIISIPSVLDPSLAPPGCHVIHAYAAANEVYSVFYLLHYIKFNQYFLFHKITTRLV